MLIKKSAEEVTRATQRVLFEKKSDMYCSQLKMGGARYFSLNYYSLIIVIIYIINLFTKSTS